METSGQSRSRRCSIAWWRARPSFPVSGVSKLPTASTSRFGANAFLGLFGTKRPADLAEFDIIIDSETDLHAWQATIRLADLHGLTVYDAAYLELAQRRRLPLASLDKALADAARAAGIEVLPRMD